MKCPVTRRPRFAFPLWMAVSSVFPATWHASWVRGIVFPGAALRAPLLPMDPQMKARGVGRPPLNGQPHDGRGRDRRWGG